MKYRNLQVFFHVLFYTLLIGCSKDKNPINLPDEIPITRYFIAGTISPQSNSYTSVYLIKLLDNNKAVFMGTGNDLEATYKLTSDSLIVEVPDPNNYRTARFAINSKKELTSAYYRALKMEYKATGSLLKISDKNQFENKTFQGKEFKMGPALFKEKNIYKFDNTGQNYGSGEDEKSLKISNKAEIINNSAFKFKNESYTEIGFINSDSLTVFRSQGLFYFGTYKLK